MEINLGQVYENLLKENITCDMAATILGSKEIRGTLLSYINKDKINDLVPYFEEDLQQIYMAIKIAQFIFDKSGYDTGLTDTEYDDLYNIMLANGGADIISTPIIPKYNKISHHKYPWLRGTLSKVFYLHDDDVRTNKSRKSIDQWKATMEAKIYHATGKHINLDNEEIYVFPKFDGVSVILEMDEDNEIENALTRGYTEENTAENITHLFKRYRKREYQEFRNNKYGLQNEAMMRESNLKYFNMKYGTDYKNTRSIVSALLNSDSYDEEKMSLIELVPLRVGDEFGNQEIAQEAFTIYPFIRCRLKDRDVIENFANSHRMVFDEFRTDGCVIHIINPELQDILGRENNKNNYEVAYKFTEEVAFSTLIDVTFSVGLFGQITPIAIVSPVVLKGNTISEISLGSIGRLRDLDLHVGDTIKVLYDIIPYMVFDLECTHNYDGDNIEIPNICPDCGEPLTLSESMNSASCTNKKCSYRIKGKIINYLNKMNIKGISYGIIDKLYDHDIVRSVEDLYTLGEHKNEIVQINGFANNMLKKWISAIDSKPEVFDYQVLGSIGIEDISSQTFKKVLRMYDIDELLEIVSNNELHKLIPIQGIQEKTARKIVQGIGENRKLIQFMLDTLCVLSSKGMEEEVSLFNVCFTKITDKEKEEFVVNHGGKVVDDLTKKEAYKTILIVPSLSTTSTKVTKAIEYGIPIVEITELENTVFKYLNTTIIKEEDN